MTNDLKFTGQIPVTINYNGSSTELYAPVRSSSCDINIVSASILDDLYTARKDDVCVKVEKGGVTIWEGYMTPNVYTQEITQNLDEIAMTAIDPVSLLKYVKVDSIMSKPNLVSYNELLARALSFVMLDSSTLYIEDNFSYQTNKGLLDLSCQVSNFWDEASEPSTLYEMIEEMLRPFCLCLAFDGQAYWIYDVNSTATSRTFDIYSIGASSLSRTGSKTLSASADKWVFADGDWISNNTTNVSIEINSTYDEVTAVASTCKVEFSDSIFDHISYNDRDKYEIQQFNVSRNIVKGYRRKDKTGAFEIDSNDYWYYIWNGVYADSEYNLSVSGSLDGWNNINPAYRYVTGSTGSPNATGSIANFYGGSSNSGASGKTQANERAVSVQKCITAYAEDNGIPPEFLSRSYLDWEYNSNYAESSEGFVTDPTLIKGNKSESIFGSGRTMTGSSRIVYHQNYPNMTLFAGDNQTVKLSLSQAYSRTGINQDIDMIASSVSSNGVFRYWLESAEDSYYEATLDSADIYAFPDCWRSSQVKVGFPYFGRYLANEKKRLCSEVWDRRRVDLCAILANGTVYQFNGKEWVTSSRATAENAFYLKNLMNEKQLFNNKMQYKLIETADGDTYSLGDEQVVYYTNGGGVTQEENSKPNSFTLYKDAAGSAIQQCSDGEIQINLPNIDSNNVTVYCDIYNSTMLGMTGSDDNKGGSNMLSDIRYQVTGTYKYFNGEETVTGTMKASDLADGVYGSSRTVPAACMFMPMNVSHVKAEHLDIEVEVTTPDSNLGQMFSESDIKYRLERSSNYLEQYSGPTFRLNTYHPLVKSSFSYLVCGGEVADPYSFTFKGGISARPEIYTTQAYMNWLGEIRKTYKKTLVPESRAGKNFNNICTFITSPEVGTNMMMVVSDSIDLKNNRHTVETIEAQDLDVTGISSFTIDEIPRRARNELFNLPTVKKY